MTTQHTLTIGRCTIAGTPLRHGDSGPRHRTPVEALGLPGNSARLRYWPRQHRRPLRSFEAAPPERLCSLRAWIKREHVLAAALSNALRPQRPGVMYNARSAGVPAPDARLPGRGYVFPGMARWQVSWQLPPGKSRPNAELPLNLPMNRSLNRSDFSGECLWGSRARIGGGRFAGETIHQLDLTRPSPHELHPRRSSPVPGQCRPQYSPGPEWGSRGFSPQPPVLSPDALGNWNTARGPSVLS